MDLSLDILSVNEPRLSGVRRCEKRAVSLFRFAPNLESTFAARTGSAFEMRSEAMLA